MSLSACSPRGEAEGRQGSLEERSMWFVRGRLLVVGAASFFLLTFSFYLFPFTF
jgi:hypothetical protein